MRAAAGIMVLLFLGGCGSPTADDPAVEAELPCRPSDESPVGSEAPGANVTLIVMIENGIDASPIQGANVSAILDDGDVDYDLYSQNVNFNRCAVAYAVTGESGMAELKVVGGYDYFVAAGDDERWFPDEPWTQEFTAVHVGRDLMVILQLYPRHVTYVWNGSIAGVDPDGSQDHEVRDQPQFGGSFPGILARARLAPSSPTLEWTNTVVWGDLFLGLAVGDDERHTDAIGNDAQDRNDGAHVEDLLGDSMLFTARRCDLVTDGLSLIVFDPGPLEAPGADGVTGLAFTYTLELELAGLNRDYGCP